MVGFKGYCLHVYHNDNIIPVINKTVPTVTHFKTFEKLNKSVTFAIFTYTNIQQIRLNIHPKVDYRIQKIFSVVALPK